MDYEEVTNTIEIPSNAGIEGFLLAVKTLLKMSRLQEIRIDARGQVTYRRFIKPGEEKNVGVDFGPVQPYGLIRNVHVEEVEVFEGASAAVVLGGLLDMVAVSQLKPLAFMTGAATVLWDWYKATTSTRLRNKETLHGLPLYRDRNIPDTALILATGYGRDAALVDTKSAYKIEMPIFKYLNKNVEVIP